MQVSGKEYSKSTVGLRQPKKILDQQFKLVFIYPMLTDEKLNKYTNLIRSFISTSMLKEIYTSNALNIIGMASSISPLIDEEGNVVDVEGGDQSLPYNSKRDAQQSAKFDMERRVQEKTQQIKKMIDIDPKLNQYKPILQMITLNSFIDVPVIVGTKSYPIQNYVLLFLFTIAIASKGKMSMSSYSDIERMFKVLKNTRTNDINVLLNNLIDLPDKDVFDKISNWITDSPKIDRQLSRRGISWVKTPASWVRSASRKIKPKKDNKKRQSLSDETVDYPGVNPDLAGQILNIAQNDVEKASVFFKLVMDPETMVSQFGYERSKGQLSKTFERINPKINEVFDNAEMYLTNTLWPDYIAPTLSTFLYTIIPTRSGINVSDLIVDIQNGSSDQNTNIKPLMQPLVEYLKGDFRTTLNNTLEKQGPEKADEMLSGIKSICQDYFEETQNILGDLNELKSHRLTGPDYDINDHIEYEKKLEEEINSIAAFTSTIDGVLRNVFPNDIVDNIMKERTVQKINDSLNSVVAYLSTFQDYPSTASFIVQANIDQANQASEMSNYISKGKKQLIFYVRFMFLRTIIYLLCQFVKETKVAVETTKHDVLDMNNYTIVTSVENILAVANAFAAKSYKDLVEKSNRNEKGQYQEKLMRDLSSNYVKGVVKYIHQQLEVPNLIVIDEKKQEIYYKLMYQSDVNKMKINTMQTFVDSILQ